jgi:hypothetical protein
MLTQSVEKLHIRKSIFCQKVTVHKDQKSPSKLKKPACAYKRDMLKLATLRYLFELPILIISKDLTICK